ncbi:helix-turn-helix domain-containing protein [Streptomyces xiaopingdaonensis]|uniref:helix-turn-helix domain-containing protein n=1 Tax=Streptomyces xiaopingdaonensis TaxID=1565415 RepID=UPI0002F34F0D|nr:helix-turn-helix domain-containing protein [Streptomyces xiaopingdaonensis]
MQQPHFGRRLKQMRTERGLSQSALVGDGMSTGYLSRLESGARRPTDRAVDYLCRRLGVERDAFEEPGRRPFLQALAIASSGEAPGAEADELLSASDAEDPTLQWHAFWLIARRRLGQGRVAEARDGFREAVRLADDLDVPELRCRARTQLARCLRSLGEFDDALTVAEQAYQVARGTELPASEAGAALLTLISCEAETGRLPDARAHSDELLGLVGDFDGTLGAEARWASATVRVRQGDYEGAQQLLGEALDRLASGDDLLLWLRLRLAAASLSFQSRPPLVTRAAERLAEAEPAVALVGTEVTRQELAALQAQLALHQGRPDDAREIVRALRDEPPRLSHRDQLRLQILEAQLMILGDERTEGAQRLRRLGEEAQHGADVDLAAEAWRLLAESLAPED